MVWDHVQRSYSILMTLADNVDNVHKVVTLTISGSDSSGGAGIQVHLHYFFEAELY